MDGMTSRRPPGSQNLELAAGIAEGRASAAGPVVWDGCPPPGHCGHLDHPGLEAFVSSVDWFLYPGGNFFLK